MSYRGHLAMSGDIFWVVTMGAGGGILLVCIVARGQGISRYPVLHGTVPTTKNNLARNITSAKAEEL